MATLLGTYVGVPNNVDASAEEAVTQKYNSFVNALGQSAGTMNTYVNDALPESQWVNDAQFSANSWAETSWAKNLIPTVALPMASTGEDADQSFKNIISGSEDSVFNGIFQAWANAGYSQMYLRPGWEMNGNWMPWSVNGSNAGDYVAAFQHIASLAHSFSGANIQVVWNPNVGGGSTSVSDIYPGNSSVDVIGLDSYGSPVNVDNSPDDTAGGANYLTLQSALDMAKANGKPFAVPETGGLSAGFPTALADKIAQSGAQVAFVNIWDTSDGNGDLTWSNDPAVGAAWKQAFQTISGGSGSTGTTTDGSTDGTTTTPTTGASLNVTQGDGSTATVDVIASGSADQSGVSQAVSNGVDAITAAASVTTEVVQLGASDARLSFIGPSSLTVSGGSGMSTISAASGSNEFVAGSGALDVTGGSGASNYVFNADSGTLKIEDFSFQKGGTISVDHGLQGGYQTADDGHGGTMLSFGTAGSIDLVNQAAPTAAQINWI